MTYVPHTPLDRAEMLATIGVRSIEDLFEDIPADRRVHHLDLPSPLSEMETARLMARIAGENQPVTELASFLGAGGYRHFIPSVVAHITGRSEFYTAYTPYQPEVSQGTLQVIYEYQSMVAELTGMDVANASMYDGASALGEAVLMAAAVTRRKRIAIASSVHPQYRAVAETYASGPDIDVRAIPQSFAGQFDARLGVSTAMASLDESCAALIVQQPNFLGAIEDLRALAETAHRVGALLIVAVNPIALALLESPGSAGADIVVGEGQPLGIPLSFGGPWLGIFAARNEFVRQMPGRIVGITTDVDGRRGLVLTLQSREQHIRRERATSNICTNQALCALASTVYLATVGRIGLRTVARLCLERAHDAARRIGALPDVQLASASPFFHEFVVRSPLPGTELLRRLRGDAVIGGYPLGRDYPDLENAILVCITEANTTVEIDLLVEAIARHTSGASR